MDNMSHVWRCNNWSKFFILHKQSSFNNLTRISLWRCNRIKYLFSPLMAKLLSNLVKFEVNGCYSVEEIVSNRDDKDEDKEITTTTAFFPNLQTLYFIRLKNLQRIGGGETGTTSVIHDQFSHVGDVPWSLCQFSSEIVIRWCESLMEVFERNGGIDSPGIPRLENINVPKLFNLKKLVIISCNLLKHAFTFSTLESLGQLEELEIKECKAMEVIVKKENEEHGKVVEFPRLKFLILFNLPKLEGFFLGENGFQWPLLENVMISACPQMKMFTSGQSTAPELKYIHTNLGKHSLECGLNFHVTTDMHQTVLPSSESTSFCSTTLKRLPWSFHNLIELCPKGDYEVKKIIPSNELLHLQKLERIQVRHSSAHEEVFEVVDMEGTNSELQTVVEIPNLRQVELGYLQSLEFIWKSNHHGTVLEFPNLTTLSIDMCHRLKHVFTSSMVGSLQKLQDLHISWCDDLLVIVEESECDGKVKEIVTLPCLKSLKLKRLESLKGFWLGIDYLSCPSLHTLEIKRCDEITVFTRGSVATPALSNIDTSFGRCYLNEDLNSFIETKRHEGFQF